VQHLFRVLGSDIRNTQSTQIKIKCALSLQHLAYVRHAIFTDTTLRQAFIVNFMTELLKLQSLPSMSNCVMKERQLYKEIVPIFMKV